MKKVILFLFICLCVLLLFFKPFKMTSLADNNAEIELLHSLNYYAELYNETHGIKPVKFTDFVEFDPLLITNDKRLNIYRFYASFDKKKHFNGFDTEMMTIYFTKGSGSKPSTFTIVDGIVYIDNT